MKRQDRPRGRPQSGLSRRAFMGSAALAGIASGLDAHAPGGTVRKGVSAAIDGGESAPTEAMYRDNIYTKLLGVRPHLPAHEHISRLSGSRMPPEVTRAMTEANEYFVDMNDLMTAAGAHIAKVLGAEAAVITSGAFSGMMLAAAACLTGNDPEKVEALPQVTWPKCECLMQKIHRFDYDRAYRAAGMTIVEVDTREQFMKAISAKTAMISALTAVEHQAEFGPPMPKSRAHGPGPDVMLPAELIEIGKKAGVPVLIDPASDIPPTENLTKYIRMGADLVVLSGGKALRGPQSAGFLAGRRDLVAAAALNNFPNANIGRGMKVGKEEIVGLVVALDRFLRVDYPAVIETWAVKARYIAEQLRGIPGLTASFAINTAGYADVDLSWDRNVIPLTPDEVKARLKQGDPPLIYDGTTVRTRCLRDGEEVLVARRLRQFFREDAVRKPSAAL